MPSTTSPYLMTSGMMRIALEREEFMDRRDRSRVIAPDAHLPAPRPILHLVADLVATRHHHLGAGDLLRVDLERLRKIARAKRSRDIAHVRANGGDPGAVGWIVTIENHAAAVRKILEDVGR